MSIRKGNTIIAGNIDAVYETDEQTITINQNEKLEVIGTINKNTLTPKYDWVGTKAEYDVLEEKNEDWLYFVTDDEKETVTLANCVGQIIQAVCTSSYIPNGCIPCDGTEYTADRFLDFWTNYLTSQPAKILTCTYNEYATDITTYGQCAKFAVDTSSQKFKAPTIKDGSFIQQAMSDSELGKSYNAGLPNIEGKSGWLKIYGTGATGAFLKSTTSSQAYTGTSSQTSTSGNIVLDASDSNPIYGNSSTVQPNAVALRYFVVVVDTYLNQSQLDWTTYTQSLNNKADKNLVNTGLITNCITEIPQDIHVELNSGLLTLKAGSKVYIPNGFESNNTTPKYKEKVLQTDTTLAFGSNTNGTFMICIQDNDYDAFDYVELSHTYSGTTNPAATYAYWYDTRNNLNKLFIESTTTPDRNESLPIAIITVVNSAVTSINQVFNGFGYIGSTIFALPGVKGLIPNGKNSDGTSKNIEFTVPTVYLRHSDQNSYNYGEFTIATTGIGISNHTLNEQENYLYNMFGTKLIDRYVAGKIAFSKTAPYNITSFTPKTVFHAIDYSEADFVAAYQRPTANNNYTWYRLYKSGWVEQGGVQSYSSISGNVMSINLPIEMTNNRYYIGMIVRLNQGDTGAYWPRIIDETTTTQIKYYMYLNNAVTTNNPLVEWEVKGFSAGY